MKKLILGICITASFCGCRQDGYDTIKCYNSVRTQYPHARIFHEGNDTNEYWTVIDSDGIYYRVVTGKTSSPEVTRVEKPIELR